MLGVTNNQKRLKAPSERNNHLQVYPGHNLWKTGTICFWPIAWLVECIFDLIPGCTRFWLQTDRVYPFLVIALQSIYEVPGTQCSGVYYLVTAVVRFIYVFGRHWPESLSYSSSMNTLVATFSSHWRPPATLVLTCIDVHVPTEIKEPLSLYNTSAVDCEIQKATQ